MVDRRAKLSVEVPYLLKKIMGVEYLLFRQRNTKDLRARTLHIEAWNESFENRVEINEYCVYSVHPENPDWTCFEQSAELDIKNFFGFEGTAEKIAIREYSKSIEKSKDIMEHFIAMLASRDITHVEPWKEPDGVVNPPEAGQEQTAENSKVRFLLKLIFLAGIFLVEFSCLCLNTKEEKQHHGNKKVQSNRERALPVPVLYL